MSCVLTLALDDSSQQHFERERRRYFPPALNRIPAHLTLFHTLPEDERTLEQLGVIASGTAAFALEVNEVRSIGRGVAFFIQSPALLQLHRALKIAFEAELSQQDRQGFRPHVVAQNKVAPDVAKQTLQALQAAFVPWSGQGVGLDLWRYLGGPWEHLRRFSFAES